MVVVDREKRHGCSKQPVPEPGVFRPTSIDSPTSSGTLDHDPVCQPCPGRWRSTLTLSSRGINGHATLCTRDLPCGAYTWIRVEPTGQNWVFRSPGEDNEIGMVLHWIDSVTARVYVLDTGPQDGMRSSTPPTPMSMAPETLGLVPAPSVLGRVVRSGCVTAEDDGRHISVCPSSTKDRLLVELNDVPTPGTWINVSASCSSYDGSLFLPFHLPAAFRGPYLWVWKPTDGGLEAQRSQPSAPCLPHDPVRNPYGFEEWAPWVSPP